MRAYYVAHGTRFCYVRGLDAARQKLAEYLNVHVEYVIKNRRRRNLTGMIQRVRAEEARAASV